MKTDAKDDLLEAFGGIEPSVRKFVIFNYRCHCCGSCFVVFLKPRIRSWHCLRSRIGSSSIGVLYSLDGIIWIDDD